MPLVMLPLTLLRSPLTTITTLLLMTTLELPSTRLSPMTAMVWWRDPTPSTFLTAVSRLSTTTPMTMMASSLRSATLALLPTQRLLPSLSLPTLLLLPMLHSLLTLLLMLLLLPTQDLLSEPSVKLTDVCHLIIFINIYNSLQHTHRTYKPIDSHKPNDIRRTNLQHYQI